MHRKIGYLLCIPRNQLNKIIIHWDGLLTYFFEITIYLTGLMSIGSFIHIFVYIFIVSAPHHWLVCICGLLYTFSSGGDTFVSVCT